MRAIEATGAEVCTAVDGSCLLQIGGGLSPRRRRCARSTSPRSSPRRDRAFPERRARVELANAQLRTNLRNATDTIRAKRARVVAELPDWEELREAGPRDQGRRAGEPRRVPRSQFEAAVEAAGGHVHWARDAAEANAIVARGRARTHGADEVVKVKSLTTDEIGLNEALADGKASTRSRPTSPS